MSENHRDSLRMAVSLAKEYVKEINTQVLKGLQGNKGHAEIILGELSLIFKKIETVELGEMKNQGMLKESEYEEILKVLKKEMSDYKDAVDRFYRGFDHNFENYLLYDNIQQKAILGFTEVYLVCARKMTDFLNKLKKKHAYKFRLLFIRF